MEIARAAAAAEMVAAAANGKEVTAIVSTMTAKKKAVAGGAKRGERKDETKGQPWTSEEHAAFLQGLSDLGRGKWRAVSRHYVPTRTPTQIASHAQKYFQRMTSNGKRKSRFTEIDERAFHKSASLQSLISQGMAVPSESGGLNLGVANVDQVVPSGKSSRLWGAMRLAEDDDDEEEEDDDDDDEADDDDDEDDNDDDDDGENDEEDDDGGEDARFEKVARRSRPDEDAVPGLPYAKQRLTAPGGGMKRIGSSNDISHGRAADFADMRMRAAASSGMEGPATHAMHAAAATDIFGASGAPSITGHHQQHYGMGYHALQQQQQQLMMQMMILNNLQQQQQQQQQQPMAFDSAAAAAALYSSMYHQQQVSAIAAAAAAASANKIRTDAAGSASAAQNFVALSGSVRRPIAQWIHPAAVHQPVVQPSQQQFGNQVHAPTNHTAEQPEQPDNSRLAPSNGPRAALSPETNNDRATGNEGLGERPEAKEADSDETKTEITANTMNTDNFAVVPNNAFSPPPPPIGMSPKSAFQNTRKLS